MIENHYSSVLVHCYVDTRKTDLSPRNQLQVTAASKLYQDGVTDTLYIPGGQIWHDSSLPLAFVLKTFLMQAGVDSQKIITPDQPVAKETSAEIDDFLIFHSAAPTQKLASLANSSHSPRIREIYSSQKNNSVNIISAESVLGVPVSNTKEEQLFKNKEYILLLLYRLGFAKLGVRLSQIPAVNYLKGLIDN